MSDPQSKLIIFNRMPKEQIIELGNFFDDILYTSPDLSKLEEILDISFRMSDIIELHAIFYNFTIGKRSPNKIFEIIDTSKLDEDKKKVLKETVQKIHDKTDLGDVSIRTTTSFLKTFGHPSIHDFTIVTEFRPISNKEKIEKFIPSLIISIDTHEFGVDKVINFQLNLNEVEKLVDKLNEGFNSLKTEIQDLRNKFGDDIIE